MENLTYETLPKAPELAESFDVFLCNGFSLPTFAIKFMKENAAAFEARPDDVFICSHPKTGTTWVQEIAYLLNSGLDYSTAKNKSSFEKVPYLEYSTTDVQSVNNMSSPRVIKTHLPFSLLPPDIIKKKCKLLYITRNPKDTVVSYYFFASWLKETQYKGTFSQFLKRFMLNRPTYAPFLQHTLEFWNQRDDPSVLFLSYEVMQKDLQSNVIKIAKFMGKNLSEEDLSNVISHCSFASMSTNKVNAMFDETTPAKFFRKGKVGDWRNHFTEEEDAAMTKWVEEGISDSGLQFTYDLD